MIRRSFWVWVFVVIAAWNAVIALQLAGRGDALCLLNLAGAVLSVWYARRAYVRDVKRW